MLKELVNFSAAAFIFGASQTVGQIAEYPADMFDSVDLSISQSLNGDIESILAGDGRARWEPLVEYPKNSMERIKSRPVGRLQIKYQRTGVCTAFLVAKNLALTNYHCIPGNNKTVTEARLYMGYYRRAIFGEMKSYLVDTTPVLSDKKLDFSLVRVLGNPGDEWGVVEFGASEPDDGDRLIIIHHPGGDPKQITQFGCKAGPISDFANEIRTHTCDTIPGSSGSPVFNDKFEVVALHNAGAPLGLAGPGVYNFSIRISKILPLINSRLGIAPKLEIDQETTGVSVDSDYGSVVSIDAVEILTPIAAGDYFNSYLGDSRINCGGCIGWIYVGRYDQASSSWSHTNLNVPRSAKPILLQDYLRSWQHNSPPVYDEPNFGGKRLNEPRLKESLFFSRLVTDEISEGIVDYWAEIRETPIFQ